MQKAILGKETRKLTCHVCSWRCTQINTSLCLLWSRYRWYHRLSTYSAAAHDVKPAATLQPCFLCRLLGLSLPWHDDWHALVVVWSQPRPRPDHFPSRHHKQPLLSASRRMTMMTRAHREGYFMPNTSRFGSGPDQMPSFFSPSKKKTTTLWRSLARFRQRTWCTKSRRGSETLHLSCNSWIRWIQKRLKMKLTSKKTPLFYEFWQQAL